MADTTLRALVTLRLRTFSADFEHGKPLPADGLSRAALEDVAKRLLSDRRRVCATLFLDPADVDSDCVDDVGCFPVVQILTPGAVAAAASPRVRLKAEVGGLLTLESIDDLTARAKAGTDVVLDADSLHRILDCLYTLADRIDALDGPFCRSCGCTGQNACEGGCGWVEADLCSSCAPANAVVVADGLGEKCEGCDKPAVTRDTMGVPLCGACFDALPVAEVDGG